MESNIEILVCFPLQVVLKGRVLEDLKTSCLLGVRSSSNVSRDDSALRNSWGNTLKAIEI